MRLTIGKPKEDANAEKPHPLGILLNDEDLSRLKAGEVLEGEIKFGDQTLAVIAVHERTAKARFN